MRLDPLYVCVGVSVCVFARVNVCTPAPTHTAFADCNLVCITRLLSLSLSHTALGESILMKPDKLG